MSAIPPINGLSSGQVNPLIRPETSVQSPGSSPGGAGFVELLGKITQTSNQHQIAANQAVEQILNNEGGGDLQSVVMSMAKADLSLKFVVEIRNKLMDAYQEIMRMQV